MFTFKYDIRNIYYCLNWLMISVLDIQNSEVFSVIAFNNGIGIQCILSEDLKREYGYKIRLSLRDTAHSGTKSYAMKQLRMIWI